MEIITYYLLNEWGLGSNIAIETRLPEYGNREITHNVEFTLHKIEAFELLDVNPDLPITARKILQALKSENLNATNKTGTLLSSSRVLKNALILSMSDDAIFVANWRDGKVEVSKLRRSASAMFECKRVGVEDGQRKGPQTIEKAKQGAYVAIKSSPLQKVRNEKGELLGVYFFDNQWLIAPYEELLERLLNKPVENDIVLTFGIVSNHGNWFTSQDMNKEMKVLAQSYDRLLFLTDKGLAEFITETILNPSEKYLSIRNAFLSSYVEGKKVNKFTKSNISIEAHKSLVSYFADNILKIEKWVNVISPENEDIKSIKSQLLKMFQV
ncbi:MAG: hypothetical protein NC453_27960 [Muribaculum sp.]|nr:hypothetical protein [Muribaculum sp.]